MKIPERNYDLDGVLHDPTKMHSWKHVSVASATASVGATTTSDVFCDLLPSSLGHESRPRTSTFPRSQN